MNEYDRLRAVKTAHFESLMAQPNVNGVGIGRRIKNGELVGQLRDVAYQATTTDFWNSMSRVGGPSTYVLGGAFNCGKAQPGQVAAVSHGCPAAVFENINVLNTASEASA
mgnify:CR=1 FL=1